MTATRIIVGIDLEATGDDALRTALSLGSDSELHLVHAVPSSGASIDALERIFTSAAEAVGTRTRAIAGELAHTPGERSVVYHVRIGEPGAVLHQVAVDVDAHLLVVGHHGRRGVQRFVLGSVAEGLLRDACCPLLVARPNTLATLPKTERPDAPREGEDLSEQRSWSSSEKVHLGGRRDSHVSGLL